MSGSRQGLPDRSGRLLLQPLYCGGKFPSAPVIAASSAVNRSSSSTMSARLPGHWRAEAFFSPETLNQDTIDVTQTVSLAATCAAFLSVYEDLKKSPASVQL